MSPYLADEARIIAYARRLRGYTVEYVMHVEQNGQTEAAREAARRELLRRRVMGGRG